ncbi:ergothioneine biosynthesis glutamate--cysteine ligase EgtA [Rhodococcus sp. HNM0569]|uniref:ergothioneine biosynthesis glutamate--cysteine ligase EgtA n=1 Tax=Rhodococcus sp. HNM0569 TaxID=2716340 RepID=UPI00146C2BCE|nr:ergothioneine biosynthesis glutamate--cysteine ligase EgtA [Rhodococcus sp. HNM0569]NLU82711.1 ergothioneine biosynthesis glutamate--cysteine ligase EgtA [Rhodococcus sp. HNM0569]
MAIAVRPTVRAGASGVPADPTQSHAFTSRPAAEAHIGGVCFKLGPPQLLGAELEWLTSTADGARPDVDVLTRALGPHTPTSIDESSPARVLPGGSAVTVEPGGQLELSSAPYRSARELCDFLEADRAALESLVGRQGIRLHDDAADADRPPQRRLESPRYRAMETRFSRLGPFGKAMMCNTAATQISVDAGSDVAAVARRWELVHAIGPAFVAAFATSPTLAGVPAARWVSQRMRAWFELDPTRTAPVPASLGYARWALDTPLLCLRRDGDDWTCPPDATFGDWVDGALDDVAGRRPGPADLDYHLSTLFPPVRARGHLEIRYVDAQPGRQWRVPIAAVEALLSGPGVMAEALDTARSTTGRWLDAAEFGLADLELRSTATALLSLAASYSTDPEFVRLLDAAAIRCCRGRRPSAADDEETR